MRGLNNHLREVKQDKEKYGEIIPMATKSFYASKNDLVALQGGLRKEFASYCPAYAIIEHMLKFAVDNGIRYYNFFGISAADDENASDYGVMQYKRAFNGKREEYLGTYEYKLLPSL